MLRLNATVLQLKPSELTIEHTQLKQHEFRGDIYTELNAEAPIWIPGNMLPIESSLGDMPIPSPHLDRYPLLIPPNRRRNTTRTGVRPTMEPRYSPSPEPVEDGLRRASIESISARLRERSQSIASNDPGFTALQFEHSPLKQLARSLRQLSISLPRSRTGSLDHSLESSPDLSRDAMEYFSSTHAHGPPIAMTISEVPSHQCAANKVRHRTRASVDTQKELAAIESPSRSDLVSRRVAVYVDSCSTHDLGATRTSKHRRYRIRSDPSSHMIVGSNMEHNPQLNRHTYPQNGSTGDYENLLIHSRYDDRAEDDVEGYAADLLAEQDIWQSRTLPGGLENTPPAQGRFERHMS